MNHRPINTLLIAASLAGAAFSRQRFDALRVPEPEHGGGSICGITSRALERGPLFAEGGGDGGGAGGAGGGGDGGAGAGGAGGAGDGDKKFSQAEVNRMMQDRVSKATKELEAKDAQLTQLVKDMDVLKTQVAEAETIKQKALEDEQTKGMTAVQKAEHSLAQAQETIKTLKGEHTTALAKVTAELEAERNGRVDDAKRNYVTTVLAGGAATGMAGYAAAALLSEGEFHLDEKRQVTKVTFEGQAFDKPSELAAAFYKARPGFAKPVEPGTGNRGAGGAGQANGLESHQTVGSLLATGFQGRTQT